MATPNHFLENKSFSNKKRDCYQMEAHEQKCEIHTYTYKIYIFIDVEDIIIKYEKLYISFLKK